MEKKLKKFSNFRDFKNYEKRQVRENVFKKTKIIAAPWTRTSTIMLVAQLTTARPLIVENDSLRRLFDFICILCDFWYSVVNRKMIIKMVLSGSSTF